MQNKIVYIDQRNNQKLQESRKGKRKMAVARGNPRVPRPPGKLRPRPGSGHAWGLAGPTAGR